MIRALRIKDFQSIEEIEVDCGPITVLYGESDTGKSAVVRALYAAAFNNYPKGHVRDGGAQCSVIEIETDDAVLRARKGAGTNQYELDRPGTEMLGWDKVGTEVPADVVDALGWRVVELDDGTKYAPNFHLQFDAPFLLTDSPSKRAKVLGSLTNVATLFAAIKQANSWERKGKTRVQAQEEIIERAAEGIGPLEAETEQAKVALGGLMGTVAKARELHTNTQMLTGKMIALLQVVEARKAALLIIEMMDKSEPQVDEIERLIPKLQGLTALHDNVVASSAQVDQAKIKATEMDHAAADIDQALHDFQTVNKMCPMCGTSWEVWG